ncbi:MAG: hypothetical protein RR514_05950 [Christensenella sp.]
MKICPLCHTKFEDSAEYCPKCKAQLEDFEEAEKDEQKKVPKSFWIALLCTFAFIGGMILIYKLVYSALL